MKRIIYTVAVVLILAGGAMAQKSHTAILVAANPQVDLNAFSFGVSGVETAEGTEDYTNNICWSNTFSVTGRDSESLYQFTISIDYTEVEPGQDTDIIGGNWSLAVFRDNRHVGTLYGEISNGTITWDKDDFGTITRKTNAKIRITGGTIDYANVGANGSGKFSVGTIMGDEKSGANGTVELLFNN